MIIINIKYYAKQVPLCLHLLYWVE